MSQQLQRFIYLIKIFSTGFLKTMQQGMSDHVLLKDCRDCGSRTDIMGLDNADCVFVEKTRHFGGSFNR